MNNLKHKSRIIQINQKIPFNIFKILDGDSQKTMSSEEVFKNKNVVIFSVPGAFTPKSTNVQIPGYLKNANRILKSGIDRIVCISVNDAFVMDAWGKHCKVSNKITMLADAHCHFFNSIGLEMDCTRFNLGFRCERFSMIVQNQKLKVLNVEDSGGPVNCSSAEIIVKQLKDMNLNE